MPKNEGHVEQEGHESEYERHPLVVVYFILTHLGWIRQKVVGGHVIGVGDPANVVCVLNHGARELRGRPAGDWRTDELR